MRWLALLVLVTSCSRGPDYGFAVAVTIQFQFDPASVTALDLFVDGDDQFETHKMRPDGRAFQSTERWVYRPAGAAKKLTLSAAARDADVVVGVGSVDVTLKAGETVQATLRITRLEQPDLSAFDGGELDASLPDGADASTARCTVAGCAALLKGCDPTVGCVSCTSLDSAASQFYVDGTSFSGGTGTFECPLKTITAGLATAATSTTLSPKIVHVAAGSYSSGETFPLVIPDNVTLDGSGAQVTIILGSGSYQNVGLATGSPTLEIQTTKPTKISNLGLRPDVKAQDPIAILCLAGTAPSPVARTAPAASTTVDAVDIGGFAQAMWVTDKLDGTPGCNLLLTSSNIHDGPTGVTAGGCDSFNKTGQPVSLQVGAAGKGNTFTNINSTGAYGQAVSIGDCVSPLAIIENTFQDGRMGVELETNAKAAVTIQGNLFTRLGALGIAAHFFSNVSVLNNTFTGIGGGAPPAIGSCHVSALCFEGDSQLSGTNNTVVGNDNGLEIAGSGLIAAVRDITFTGGTLSCNSNGSNGHDVWVHLSSVSGGTLALDHNHWDNATPTQGSGDGNDIFTPSPSPALGLNNPQSPAAACTGGRIR